MTAVITGHISISLDGYVAGPSQSAEDPLGRGGLDLHSWLFAGEAADYLEEANASAAAFIMGRHMFGPGRGQWDLSWQGWWGGNPFNGPVFVLTHYERHTLVIGNDAPFRFVTAGIVSALEQAHAVADGRDVMIVGGADTIRQYLVAGLLDELRITITPVILGAGERLLDGIGKPKLAQLASVCSGSVTHLRYRIER
jgi:dihydrofolate reductase